MDSANSDKEEVSIEEAINITSGTLKYQKMLVLIHMLGTTAVMPLLICVPVILPQISKDCTFSSCSDYDTIGFLNIEDTLSLLFRISCNSGTIVGLILTSILADRYGRKEIIKNSCILGAFALTATAFSNSPIMLCLGMFAIGILFSGIVQIGFILCSEVVNYKQRNLYLSMFFINICLSSAVFSALYSISNIWRYLILGAAVLVLVQAFLMRYIYESPRYLVTNKVDIEAAISVLKKISLINGEGDFRYSIISENFNKKASRSINAICSSKLIVLKITGSISVWLCVLFAFYSFIFYKPAIFDNNSYNELSNNLLKIVPFPVFIYVIDTLGRKKTVFFSTAIIGGIFIIIGGLQSYGSESAKALHIFW